MPEAKTSAAELVPPRAPPASYRLAIVKSVDQVALEMGNSPAKIRPNYHDPKSEDEALAYFSLRPEAPANVIPMSSPAN